MKYQIFVKRKKVSNELKISILMSLKMFTFLHEFSDIPGVFFVKYSENHRIFKGGIPNILLFILYQRLAIMEAVEI